MEKKIPKVKDFNKFINTEIYAINWHSAVSRVLGDNRSENEIVMEWITENAEKFRNDFIMSNGA